MSSFDHDETRGARDDSGTGEGDALSHGVTMGGSVAGGTGDTPIAGTSGATDLTSGGKTSGGATGQGGTGSGYGAGRGTSGSLADSGLSGDTIGGEVEDAPGEGRDLAQDVMGGPDA